MIRGINILCSGHTILCLLSLLAWCSSSFADSGLLTTIAPVQPGTQGYKGQLSTLPIYSAANDHIPPGTTRCSWNKQYNYLRCDDDNLTFQNVYIQGGVYWTGCGSLTIANSIIDWQPSHAWFVVHSACKKPESTAVIKISNATIRTGLSSGVVPNQAYPLYTGGSDIGAVNQYTGTIPIEMSNSLVAGFPQGIDIGSNADIIQNNEMYVFDAKAKDGSLAHTDNIFINGGSNPLIQGNYMVNFGKSATAVIFIQAKPNVSGSKIIGNYLQGGAYTIYNENGTAVTVKNNTFGGFIYGNCRLYQVKETSWGQWDSNMNKDGTLIHSSGPGCN